MRGKRRQFADASDDRPQRRSVQQLVQQQATVDDILEVPGIARLAQVLVSERYQADRLAQIGVAGKDDPNGLWPAAADDAQQLRTVHSGHPHVRHDDVVGLPFHLLDRQGAARDAIHRPFAAAAHQAVAQSIEGRLLIVTKRRRFMPPLWRDAPQWEAARRNGSRYPLHCVLLWCPRASR